MLEEPELDGEETKETEEIEEAQDVEDVVDTEIQDTVNESAED